VLDKEETMREVREVEIAELRAQRTLLEAAKLESDHAARKAEMQLLLLILALINERGICAVMINEGREWEFLTKEAFKVRYKGNGFVAETMNAIRLKKKAA